jgi:hypothetical protein
MQRLVERFLREKALAFMPLHPNQHAYQAGKSVKTTLRQLVVWVENVLDQQETALDVFLDIEGAFSNTSVAPCVLLLSDIGLAAPFTSGLELPWKSAWPW